MINISNISHADFFERTRKALLSAFNLNVTKDANVRKFLKHQLAPEQNEHIVPSLFTADRKTITKLTGTYVSEWEEGILRSAVTINLDDFSLNIDVVDVGDDYNHHIKDYITIESLDDVPWSHTLDCLDSRQLTVASKELLSQLLAAHQFSASQQDAKTFSEQLLNYTQTILDNEAAFIQKFMSDHDCEALEQIAFTSRKCIVEFRVSNAGGFAETTGVWRIDLTTVLNWLDEIQS